MQPRSRYTRRREPTGLMSVLGLLKIGSKAVSNSDERRNNFLKRIRRDSGKPRLCFYRTQRAAISRLAGIPNARKVKELEGNDSLGYLPSRSISSTPSFVANRTSLVGRSATRNFQTGCDMCFWRWVASKLTVLFFVFVGSQHSTYPPR